MEKRDRKGTTQEKLKNCLYGIKFETAILHEHVYLLLVPCQTEVMQECFPEHNRNSGVMREHISVGSGV
jgi:hypothetical protein